MAKTSLNHPLKNGTRLATYTIKKRLSSGGFGLVYLAVSDQQRSVAIKEFLPSLISCRSSKDGESVVFKNIADETRFNEGLKIFFREVDLISKIKNSKVVDILDIFQANGTAYYVMPLEQGESLQRLVRRTRGISDEQIQKYFLDVTEGIQSLHAQGVLHLDIKPANLWVRPDQSVIVLDLGASRDQETYRYLGPPARTPGFAAPEQHGSARFQILSPQTDIYGICASMCSCVNGYAPIPAPSRTLKDETMLESRLGQRSAQILNIIDKGMMLEPSERWKSAEELHSALLSLRGLKTRKSTESLKIKPK